MKAPPKRPDDGIPHPNGIKEVPRYLLRRAGGLISRLWYIIGLVWETSPLILIAMCLLCVVDGLLPVIGSYITRDLMNGISAYITNGALDRSEPVNDIFGVLAPIMVLLVMQMVYMFAKRVLTRVNSMVTSIAGELVVNHIKLKIIGKAKTVDQRSYDDPAFYERLENANREAGMRPIHILSATFNVISGVISVVSFIVVLATLNPIAPLVIILASVPGAIVNYYFRNKNFKYIRRHSNDRRRMQYYSSIMTNKDHAKEIKILGLGDTFTEKYNAAFRGYYKGLKKIIVRECLMQLAVSLIYVLASGALFVYVAYKVVFGTGLIGDYSLYTGALTSITTHVSTIVTATATIYEGTLFIENMLDFMKEKSEIVPTVEPARPIDHSGKHTIEFRGVSFSYPGTDKKVLSDINLTLTTGEGVILVGLNGAGKSTLLKLVMRLYDPTEGVILLDGHDIREYDVKELYSIYGIIFQDFGKYADTVSENIRFGDIDREDSGEGITEAAERGNAAAFISELPSGYETPLTRMFEENGIELSGGQWQKLSIARAFYNTSEILIMDEPTASLDPLAEQEVFNQFSELSEGKLSIFVSHRLSGATTAGKIIVLEGGKLVEMGTHHELMALEGRYHRLFTTQANRYLDVE